MSVKYRYIGCGSYLIFVPARDLTDADFVERRELWREYGITEEFLIKSGLYKKVETPKAGKPKKEGE